MAIGHLGFGKEIANLDTEQSEEAAACRRYYEFARDATLRDFPWPFAMVNAVLNLIENDPTTEWAYSYRYPVDCIFIRRIVSGNKQEDRDQRVAYKVGKDDSGKIIYSDQAEAQIEYTQQVTDPEFYTSDFTFALSLRLAAYIAPRLTKGDPYKLRNAIIEQYKDELENVKSNTLNEEKPVKQADSEFIRARS